MSIGEVLQALAERAADKGAPFLLVGGWALNAHGVSRQTLDVDILVRERDVAVFEAALSDHGYTKVYATDLFAKFRAEDQALMDVDCLLTDDDTIEKMLEESQIGEIEGVTISIPSLSHLIAMKLHALKHNKARRHGRDLPDIVALVQVNHVEVSAEEFKDLCLTFGTEALYQELVEAITSSE